MANKAHIKVSYDDLADVLYLTSGKVTLTSNTEDEAGLVLRYDLKTQKPIGATILDFKGYWTKKNRHLVKRLSEFFQITTEDAKKAIELSAK